MNGFDFRRTPMESESPEEIGYLNIRANLAESSLPDQTVGALGIALDDLVLLYGDHRGDPRLRELVAQSHGVGPQNVLATSGAALGLFLTAVALLGPGTELVVASPNYVANIETARALGGEVVSVELSFASGWQIDPGRIEAAITDRTRLISVTSPHNPTGTEISRRVFRRLVEIVERTDRAYLLIDQTYLELSGPEALTDAASLSSRVISVSGVSKTYGVPGIRQGWVVCTDADLMDTLLGVKEQVVLTGSVLDEAIAASILSRSETLLPEIRRTAARRRAIVDDWITGHPALEWVVPTGGVIGFPWVKESVDLDPLWHEQLLAEHGVLVGPGHWFGQPWRHFRIGWGWPSDDELRLAFRAIDVVLGVR